MHVFKWANALVLPYYKHFIWKLGHWLNNWNSISNGGSRKPEYQNLWGEPKANWFLFPILHYCLVMLNIIWERNKLNREKKIRLKREVWNSLTHNFKTLGSVIFIYSLISVSREFLYEPGTIRQAGNTTVSPDSYPLYPCGGKVGKK